MLAPIMMVGSLLREMTSDPASLELIHTVNTSAQRGADIIKQLLIFARGRPESRVPLPAQPLLRELHQLIRETFPRNIRSQVKVSGRARLMLADPTQVHQALLNLCVNARDAMPAGGALTLTAEPVTLDAAQAARAFEARPGEYVCLSVADTGTGIPTEILDHIYEPFFTTKASDKGTGLGLATVTRIVKGHDGFLEVESHVGQGTTFRLYFPAVGERPIAEPAEAARLPPRGQDQWVLVVDDEAIVRAPLRRILEGHGYRVLTAAEGQEALTVLDQHRPEVKAVITDLMMPGMDGLELARRLRRSDPGLPILAMTGLTQPESMKELAALSLPILLRKPFTLETLLRAVHQVLTGSPAAGA